MNAGHLIHATTMAALIVSAGCATDYTQSSAVEPSAIPIRFVIQDQARHLAFSYRQRAAENSALATRLELEAAVFSRQLGPDHEESTRRLAQVKELLAASEEADELSRAYRRQVPHGQVQ